MSDKKYNPEIGQVSDIYTFPDWIKNICPPGGIIAYIRKKGIQEHEVPDICTLFVKDLHREKKEGKSLNISYTLIVLNSKIAEHLREKSKRTQNVPLEYEQFSPVSRNGTSDKRKKEFEEELLLLVNQAINKLKLGLRERVIIKLRTNPKEEHRFAFSEIADIVGYSEATVRTEFNKYKQFIKNYVNERIEAGSYSMPTII